MKQSRISKALSVFMSIVLACAVAVPTAAFAAQPEVQIENHTNGNALTVVSGITIDGVDAPVVGSRLDDTAVVKTAEGETWDVAVLWVDDTLQVATEAKEGRQYLPAIAFFVPQNLTVAGDSYTVTLSESLVKLFGSEETISVYDSGTNITYILPASLKDFFVHARTNGAVRQSKEVFDEPEEISLVDLYCAETARDVLSDDDLEYLIDLVLHRLQPQAVELLLNSFPAFRTAADNGQIGTRIGLYIYYQEGDQDGLYEHESAPRAYAYVSGSSVDRGGVKYCYMMGIDVSDLLLKDEQGELVRDESSGKFILVRDANQGSAMVTFNNTIVHEMFHAFMDDYNRTGMEGCTNLADTLLDDSGNFRSPELADRYKALRFPTWFREGSASAVENNYMFRYQVFKYFRAVPGSKSQFEDVFTANTLLYNYLNAENPVKPVHFDLRYAADKENNGQAAYATGYLAVLYLSQLAAQSVDSIGSAVNVDKAGNVAISSARLRLGLNYILEEMHNGKSLDQVVKTISTVSPGNVLYTSTDDFEAKFIKGVDEGNETYKGDSPSISFVLYFLNYMRSLEKDPARELLPNGSILFDLDEEFTLPLDPEKESTSEYYVIVDSNQYVESTADNSIALSGGGKSNPDAVASSAPLAVASTSNLSQAAKAYESSTDAAEQAHAGKANANTDAAEVGRVASDAASCATSAALATKVQETASGNEAQAPAGQLATAKTQEASAAQETATPAQEAASAAAQETAPQPQEASSAVQDAAPIVQQDACSTQETAPMAPTSANVENAINVPAVASVSDSGHAPDAKVDSKVPSAAK